MSWRSLFLVLLAAAVLAAAGSALESDATDSVSSGVHADPAHHPPAGGDAPPFPEKGPSPSGGNDPGLRGHPHDGKNPAIVLDAKERPDGSPERLIEDYMGLFEEKAFLESQGATVYVYDPALPDEELSGFIVEAMGGAVISDLSLVSGPYSETAASFQASAQTGMHFLGVLLRYAEGSGSGAAELISSMLQELRGTQDAVCAASCQNGSGQYPEDMPEPPRGEEDSGSEPGFFQVLSAVFSEETYLSSHVFDGGAGAF